MISAYFDESIGNSGAKHFLIAGYVMEDARWDEFSKLWKLHLSEFPSISYFKMTEAHNLRGQFKGFSRLAANRKVRALARLISSFDPWFISCTVSSAEYKALVAPVSPYPLMSPYAACFLGCIFGTTRSRGEAGLKKGVPIHFFFDRQDGAGEDAILIYRRLREEQFPELGNLIGASPCFIEDHTTPAIQAADMLSWHLRKLLESESFSRDPILRMVMTCGATAEIDSDTLKKWSMQFKGVAGVGDVQSKAEWQTIRRELIAADLAGVKIPHLSNRQARYLRRKRTFLNWISRTKKKLQRAMRRTLR